MNDEQLRNRLVSGPKDTPIVPQDMPSTSDLVTSTAIDVMRAYQNANKWLDTIKENLLMDQGSVFFSTYIHNLAHTMPVRFDKFGDILHTVDMKVPYPATEQLGSEPSDINTAFEQIFSILDSIKNALLNFIKATGGTGMHGMACSAEALLNDIEGEYPALFRMRRGYGYANGDIIKFDKWVRQYVDHASDILG